MAEPSAKTITTALKLLMSQRKAARAYYGRNADAMKARSAAYWEAHREEINRRRRERYAAAHPRPALLPDTELCAEKPAPLT